MPNSLPIAPVVLTRGVEALDGLCALLACADEDLWATVARPKPHALAALAFTIHGEIAMGLSEVVRLPEAAAASHMRAA